MLIKYDKYEEGSMKRRLCAAVNLFAYVFIIVFGLSFVNMGIGLFSHGHLYGVKEVFFQSLFIACVLPAIGLVLGFIGDIIEKLKK
ncbi:hypothetical protein [Veillonella sp. DNF00869]|uniref:hypothetical protein n=1 Tax=Veillonella sp. DNF00869 TaxID=1384081 RepID=UPI000785E545|nr:hypothetical protein [Veillonella sp. DNF00869]KXB86749.1 hypothetical protein HMPREF3032_01435 [Veillonella sp. DNF00869]